MEATLIKTNRKTVSLQIKQDGTILVRAPLWYKKRDLEKLLKKHEKWIKKTEERQKNRTIFPEDKVTVDKLKNQAKEIIPKKVAYFAQIMKLSPAAVRIGSARGRFGSCSSKGNLNFSCFLMLYPEKAIDYVVVHELAHLKCRGHDQRFYNLVAEYMPDYKEREKLLKQ